LISDEDLKAVAADAFVVATQTCDLFHQSFQAEPEVELLFSKVIGGAPPGDAGKSFRTTSIPLEGSEPSHLRVLDRKPRYVSRKLVLERAVLASDQPNDRARVVFAAWLADRYVRTAFPDALVQMLACDGADERIKKSCDRVPFSSGLYFGLNDYSESPACGYEIKPLVLMPSKSSLKEIGAANTALTEICGAIRKAGIRVPKDSEDGGVKKEDEVTVAGFRYFRKWHLDYLTGRDKTGAHTFPPITPA
jgi:hypothetical protein